jgi:hypothetical protein
MAIEKNAPVFAFGDSKAWVAVIMSGASGHPLASGLLNVF